MVFEEHRGRTSILRRDENVHQKIEIELLGGARAWLDP